MSSVTEPNGAAGQGGRLDDFRDTFSRSVSLKVATFGVVLLVLATLINFLLAQSMAVEQNTAEFDIWGLWAAILSVWGGAMIILGILVFVYIWWRRQ